MIAILTAMSEEIAPFRQRFATDQLWKKGKSRIEKVIDRDILLVETGIGKANAAFTAGVLLERYHPRLLVNSGTAGGFGQQLQIGDVVVATRNHYTDVDASGFNYLPGQVPQMPEAYFPQLTVEEFPTKRVAVHFGAIGTSDSFMTDISLVTAIRKQFPELLASDMESTAIAQVAAFYDRPFINIRGISDLVGSEAAKSFDENLSLAAENAAEVVVDYLKSNYKHLENL